MVNFTNKIRTFSVLLSFLSLASVIFGAGNIAKATGLVCATALNMLPIAVIVLAVLAALVYAIGQVLGAETRARATVWATAMFTGAIIGIIIFLLVPTIINVLLGAPEDVNLVQECCRPDPTEACASSTTGGSD